MRGKRVRGLAADPRRAAANARVLARDALAQQAARLAGRLRRRHYVPLWFPPAAADVPRYGWGRPPHERLRALLARHEHGYRTALELVVRHEDAFARIGRDETGPPEPFWAQGWLPPLDAMTLYAFLRNRSPARYVEIGSGMSTRFADRARRDGGHEWRLTSIDPSPRAEVDAVCDEVVREPLESADLALFGQLGAGDVVFMDGSHQVFMNSDATTFFLDVLPALPAGVLVGVHDVFLPLDYPPHWAGSYVSEQYLLAAYLLAEGPWLRPALATSYADGVPHLREIVAPLWPRLPALEGLEQAGRTFWLSIGGRT